MKKIFLILVVLSAFALTGFVSKSVYALAPAQKCSLNRERRLPSGCTFQRKVLKTSRKNEVLGMNLENSEFKAVLFEGRVVLGWQPILYRLPNETKWQNIEFYQVWSLKEGDQLSNYVGSTEKSIAFDAGVECDKTYTYTLVGVGAGPGKPILELAKTALTITCKR